MLYASRLGYIRRCIEHSAEDFFLKSVVLGINGMSSEILLLSVVETQALFTVACDSN